MTGKEADTACMAHALRLGKLGMPTTHPNPRVGCVIVNQGEVVGSGWHRRAGGDHAEIIALGEAGDRARGATVYVSLEPCCHQGRTPPCTDALIDSGVARVVAAVVDPNPQVSGGGARALRNAGVEVELGLLEDSARQLNIGYFSRFERGRPWVRLKLGASLDGRTAMADGESRWITSEEARRDVHRLRALSSAILTGSGTALADNPALTVRSAVTERQPLRVLIDSAMRVAPDRRLFEAPGDVLVCTTMDEGDGAYPPNVDLVRIPGTQYPNDRRVDLDMLMEELVNRQINEVLVEAGPGLSGALVSAGLVDQLYIYLAPKCLGAEAKGMLELPGMNRLADSVGLRFLDVRFFGEDLRITAEVCEA